MKQKLFKKCGLFKLTDGGKSRLLKVRSISENTFETEPISDLSEPQTILDVYPDANLIVTQDKLLTLDGKVVLQHNKAKLSIEPVGNKWMITQDSLQDNDVRYSISFWDGSKDYDFIFGRYLLKADKYFAVYTSGDRCWLFYQYDGNLVLVLYNTESDMKIYGDFLMAVGIGTHSLYSLLPQCDAHAKEHCIFRQKSLILCSSHTDFALSANLQGIIQTYYCGKFSEFGQAQMVELYDFPELFCIKRDGKYFLYQFNGAEFAEDICPNGADSVSYDKEDKTLLIEVNGVFHIMQY